MILCCGEALIDMIPETTVSGTFGFVPHQGGAVHNTAIALGRLGAHVGLLTGISTDMFGAQLNSGLVASNVDTAHMIATDHPTTLAFVALNNGQASYCFFDENSAGRMLKPADMPALSNDVTVLFFGGISLACEPGADAYEAVLHAEGCTRAVMIDPNIRPSFIEDEGRYRARLDRMIAAADIVKVSDEDLHWMIPGPPDLSDKAKTVQAQGPAIVIVTQGKEGATAYLQNGQSVSVLSKSVDVVDTVGAGDTFNAGVLAKLSHCGVLSKDSLRDVAPEIVSQALEYGATVATVVVSRAGANPPWAREIE